MSGRTRLVTYGTTTAECARWTSTGPEHHGVLYSRRGAGTRTRDANRLIMRYAACSTRLEHDGTVDRNPMCGIIALLDAPNVFLAGVCSLTT